MHFFTMISAALLATTSLATGVPRISRVRSQGEADSNDPAGINIFNTEGSCKSTTTPHRAPTSAISKYCYNIPSSAKTGKIIWPDSHGTGSYQAVFYSQPGCPEHAQIDRMWSKKLDYRLGGVCSPSDVWGHKSGGRDVWKGKGRRDASVWIAPREAGAPGGWPVR